MKKHNLTILLLLIVYNINAQFNIIVEDSTNNHLYIQVIENNDSYNIINGTSDSIGNRAVSIIKCDTSGKILSKKTYSKTGESWYEGLNYCYNSELKVMAGTVYSNNMHRGKLYFFNDLFDTIFTKTFFYDTLETYFYSLINTYDNNIVVSGSIEDTDGDYDACIIKFNLYGDTIWVNKYGGNTTDVLGYKIIETTDKGYISIGYCYEGWGTDRQDWYIVKTDSLGNLEWWQHPGDISLNDGAAQDIVQTQDSCFVVVGGKAVYEDAGGTKYDGRIIKYDINGNVIWDKTYRKRLSYSGYDSVYCFFNSIVELNDGGFAVVSTVRDNVPYVPFISSLYRFNSEGDTLWTRKFCSRCSYLGDGSNSAGIAYPATIQETENGGLLIGGYGFFDVLFSHPYSQQMFLIKTDSLGCDGTEYTCPLVNIPSVVKNEESVLVYPNPATNNVQLVINNEQYNKNTSVFIYNVYGKVVKQLKIENLEFKIQVADLEKGIYFIKIGNTTKKFVKL